jgi:hypothetical protein
MSSFWVKNKEFLGQKQRVSGSKTKSFWVKNKEFLGQKQRVSGSKTGSKKEFMGQKLGLRKRFWVKNWV